MRRKIHGFRFDYVIAGPTTRGGSLIADSRQAAVKQLEATLQPGEYIYTLVLSHAV